MQIQALFTGLLCDLYWDKQIVPQGLFCCCCSLPSFLSVCNRLNEDSFPALNMLASLHLDV